MFVSRIPSLTARRQIVQIPPISSLPFCPFSQSLRGNDSQKDSQDKDTINTETTEYSKSGTDDSAAHEKVAFDPKTTSPEQEKIDAGKENKVSIQAAECGKSSNPLDVSPANQAVSKPRRNLKGAAELSPNKKTSGHGSPKEGETAP